MQRLAIFGLDAVEWSLAERLLEEGKLPNLASLRSRSSFIPLKQHAESIDNPWLKFWSFPYSGPGTMVEFDPASYQAKLSPWPSRQTFLSRMPSRKAIVFDVPSVPVDIDLPGTIVHGWDIHGGGVVRASRPRGTLTQIDKEFGVHPAYHLEYETRWSDPTDLRLLGDALTSGIRRRAEITRWLLDRNPGWDLLVTVFPEGHTAGEMFWHGVESAHPLNRMDFAREAEHQMIRVMASMDEAIGSVFEAAGSDAVKVVLAVHGMESNRFDVPSMVLLPELLFRLEFGRPFLQTGATDELADEAPPSLLSKRENWGSHMRRRLPLRPWNFIQRFYLAPDPWMWEARKRLMTLLGRPMAARSESSAEDEAELQPKMPLNRAIASWYRHYWPRMKTFAIPSFTFGSVRLNLEGRESAGIIPKDQYDKVLDELEQQLLQLRDRKDGVSVIEEIVRPRGTDPADDHHPADLVVVWKGVFDRLYHPSVGVIGPVPFIRTGGHSTRGFAMISGKGTTPGQEPEKWVEELPLRLLNLIDER